MDTGMGDTINYIELSPSTVTQKEKTRESKPTYDVAPGTGKPDYGTAKPYRIQFKVERVKKIIGD